MSKFIGTLIIFAALTLVAFWLLAMFWHNSTVVFVALDVQFTWRLLVAMAISVWATSKIA
jgi:hypothetical protein